MKLENYLLLIAIPCMLNFTACSIQEGNLPIKHQAKEDSNPRSNEKRLDNVSIGDLIDPIVLNVMETEYLPGVAVVIVQNGETVFKKGYGYSNIELDKKVNPDITIFRIGSVSKALTSLAVTRLDDQGSLSLDDSVDDYFDGFEEIPNIEGGDASVTIRNLITHTSGLDQIGIGRHIWKLDLDLEERKALRPSINDFLNDGNLRRTAPPGQHYRYDTYGKIRRMR